jgi:hypothetical protein
MARRRRSITRYNRWSAQGLWRKLSSFGMERQSNPFLAG